LIYSKYTTFHGWQLMPVGKCKLCLQTKDLQKSHLMPASLYKKTRNVNAQNPNPTLITKKGEVQTSRQIRDYLLCRECEQLFSKNGENYVMSQVAQGGKGGKFPLLSALQAAKPTKNAVGFDWYDRAAVPSIDREKLGYYALSVFWRASVHLWKEPGLNAELIDLGAYDEPLRKYLLGQTGFPANVVLLTRAAPPVHPTVERTIRHCLEKNPIERFRSAHDLAFQLELAAEGLFPKAEMAVTHSSAFRLRLVLPLVLALLLVALPLVFLIGRLSARPEPPAYKRLTFRTGSVSAARFSSDGRTIVYAAAWEGNPSEIFVSRVDSSEARPLGIGPSELLSVSKNGELAVLLKPEFGPWRASGTLASISLEGGTPREIAEDVTAADWAPDGSGLAIVRKSDRLEFPIGKVLFQSAGWLDHPRFSPDGKSIAFFEHPSSGGNGGSLVTCDLIGTIKIIATGLDTALSLAWSPNGKEVWFSGVRGPGAVAILAISREGKERLVARDTGWMTVHDVARDGRVLLTRDDWRVGVKALAPHSTEERELSWFEWSLMGAISPDGEMIAFSESAEAVAGKGYTYVRSIRGTPAVRLGEGRPTSISPDKKWVAVTTETVPPQLVLLPTGSGEPKRFPSITGHIFYPQFLADGKRIAFGVAAGSTDRLYSMVLDTGEVKPALPESVIGFTFSPDGKSVVASGASDLADKIYDLSGGPPRPIRGLNKGESVEAWGNDPLPLYVSAREGSAVNLYRLDPVSGNRQLWRRLMPSDPAGVRLVADIYIAPDAQAYGYSYYRFLSQLCMGEGLR
jgi:eukaryotic-like serine/threonine-protein kinase